MSSSWSDDLPDDVLLLIAKKVIGGSDFKSFGQVCSSWRSVSKQDRQQFRPVLPGILTRQGLKSESNAFITCRLFGSLSKLKRWPQLRLPKTYAVCGSHQGWIVMMKGNPHNKLTLINPVSHDRLHLPYTTASRIIFSANPTDCNCYYIIADPDVPLRCCKSGDMGWNVVGISGEKNPSLGFVDAVYYRGKLYAMRATGELFVCDDITASPPIVTKLMNTPLSPQLANAWRWPTLGDGYPLNCFLVESGQELLLVYSKEKYLSSGGLEVYRLDIGGSLRWDHVTNLGEHALFLGKSPSFSLSESDVRGVKGNHVYYTREDCYSWVVCVFNLENSWAEVVSIPTKFPLKKSPGIWFMPQLFS